MIELRTFGRLDLRDPQGDDIGSVLVHPKRVALLVYLAVSRPAGFNRRDSLVAMFWPELDQEHARASLRKALHHLRRSLGEDVVIGRGDEEISLNPAVVASDVARFRKALENNDPARALELYQGPFLDGFFVRDAAGFEDWLERERQHLQSEAFNAAWMLAEAVEAAGDTFGASHWARRAAALAPTDEGAVRKLITILDRLGDRAGALAAYDDFAARLYREYEVEPSSETRMLADAVRRRADPEAAAETIAPVTPPPAVIDAPADPPAIRRKKARAWVIAAMTIVAVGALAALLFLPKRATPVSARVIAVMPFNFRGDDELAYLSEGMVSLLSTNLDQLGDFRSVDAAGVMTLASSTSRGDPGAIAERLGAGLYVTGDIVEMDGKLRVSAGLYDARRGGRAIASANAEGEASQIFDVIDQVTSQLVAGERRAPAERFTRLALLTTHSVPALKAYLIGEQHFRAGRYNESVESFQKAVEADTTFALGYYRLALALSWGSSAGDRDAADRAIQHARRLAGPDRALIDALVPFFSGDVEKAESQYNAILVTRPDESEVWYPLGEVLFHYNPMRGRPAAEAKASFERALSLGPKDGPLTHLVEIAALERDYVAFDTLYSGIQPASHFYFVGELMRAFLRGDEGARSVQVMALRDSSDERVLTAARHMMFLMEDRAAADRVLEVMIEPKRQRALRSWGYVHRAHLAISAGQPAAASKEIAQATPLDPARALEHEAWLYSLPFVNATRSELKNLRDRLAAAPPSAVTPDDADLKLMRDLATRAHIRLYLLGLLDAQLGDYESAERAAHALPQIGGSPAVQALATDLMHAVRAEVLRRQGDGRAALAELERARLQFDVDHLNTAPFYPEVRERYVRAELLAENGRPAEALRWFSSFDEHGPWGRVVLAPAAIHQARVYESLGRKSDAARNYARAIALWHAAEPRFASQVSNAKQRLAAIQHAD